MTQDAGTGGDLARPSSLIRAGIVLVADADLGREAALLVARGYEVVSVPVVERVDLDTDASPRSDFDVLAHLTRARDRLDPSRPRFVVGLGPGGLYARMFACSARGLAGAVSFQGTLVYPTLTPSRPAQPMDLLPGLGCPLLCHLAELDPDLTAAHVARLEERLRDCRPSALVYRYDRASAAAFRVDERARSTTESRAHALAWARTHTFLAHLVAAAG